MNLWHFSVQTVKIIKYNCSIYMQYVPFHCAPFHSICSMFHTMLFHIHAVCSVLLCSVPFHVFRVPYYVSITKTRNRMEWNEMENKDIRNKKKKSGTASWNSMEQKYGTRRKRLKWNGMENNKIRNKKEKDGTEEKTRNSL